MELRLRLALFNLWIVACVLPWSGDDVRWWARLGVAVLGLVTVVTAIVWESRPQEQRVVVVVALSLALAIVRPWPTWSWLVVLASVAAVLLLGFVAPSAVHTKKSPGTAPLRWRRRMTITRALGVLGAGSGIALLIGANRAELAVPGRPLGVVFLLLGAAGLLALFAMRQFFLLPAIEHVAEDRGVRAQLARSKTHRPWVRYLRLLALAAGAAWFVLTTTGGKP